MHFLQPRLWFQTQRLIALLMTVPTLAAGSPQTRGAAETSTESNDPDHVFVEKLATGCLAREHDGRFVLLNARLENAAELNSSQAHRTKPDVEIAAPPAVSPAPTGTASSARVSRIVLDGPDAEFERLVGNTVQVSGRPSESRDASPQGGFAQPTSTGGETHPAETPTRTSGGSDSGTGTVRLSVQSAKKISSGCP
jgi:hypothetical protein